MKTAVVILNWNTEGFLRDFLPALVRSAEKAGDAEVIVADNGSTDGSLQVMKDLFPQVRTIAFERNHGFTGGYNRAFREIYGTLDNPAPDAPKYFLLINSDIEVYDGWLQPLVDWMDSHPDCGACAPKLHSWQEKDSFEYAGAAGGLLDSYGYPFCRGRVMRHLEKDHGQYDAPADVFWATGACLMVRSKVYAELGGLDERFFAHMEEIDLCWRMQLRGWKVTVVPQSTVYHVGGGTLPASSPFKLFLNFRNNLLTLDNNLASTYALAEYRKGRNIRSAARIGICKSRLRILLRRDLDGCSAVAYMLGLKWANLKAVMKAGREYSVLKHGSDVNEVAEYLRHYGDRAHVCGLYRKWIVPRAILKGRKIFTSIREKDFVKI